MGGLGRTGSLAFLFRANDRRAATGHAARDTQKLTRPMTAPVQKVASDPATTERGPS